MFPKNPDVIQDIFKKISIEKIEYFNALHGLQVYQLNMNNADSLGSGSKLFKIIPTLNYIIDNNITDILILGDINSTSCHSFLRYAKEINVNVNYISTGDLNLANKDYFETKSFSNCKEYYLGSWDPIKVEKTVEDLKSKIPNLLVLGYGISHPISVEGVFDVCKYIDSFQENNSLNFDVIVVSAGSGGLLAGFSLFKYMNEARWNVLGVSIFNDVSYFIHKIHEYIDWHGNKIKKDEKYRKNFDLILSNESPLYQKIHKEDEELIATLASVGVYLDGHYVLKCVKHLLENHGDFDGKTILLINSHGIKSEM